MDSGPAPEGAPRNDGFPSSRSHHLGRRTARTLPLLPPPQKNRSLPSDSSPDTVVSGGMSSRTSSSPVFASMPVRPPSSFSQLPCQSSPSTQVTPLTKRLHSMVRRILPV